jgi:hypothetical protein
VVKYEGKCETSILVLETSLDEFESLDEILIKNKRGKRNVLN